MISKQTFGAQSMLPTIDLMDAHISTSTSICDRLLKSPCRCRPDTGKPCPLLNHQKNNRFCEHCQLLNGGKAGPDVAGLMAAIASGEIDNEETDTRNLPREENFKYDWDRPKRGPKCAVPWCDNPPKGDKCAFCKTCNSTVNSRVVQWYKRHITKPPLEWLYRKPEYRGARARKA